MVAPAPSTGKYDLLIPYAGRPVEPGKVEILD